MIWNFKIPPDLNSEWVCSHISVFVLHLLYIFILNCFGKLNMLSPLLMQPEQFCGCLAWLMYNFKSEVFNDVPRVLEQELLISMLHPKVKVRDYIEEMDVISSGFKFNSINGRSTWICSKLSEWQQLVD